MGAAARQAGVTDAFLAYARPLIGDGLQRFARLQPRFADRRCPEHVPEAY